MTQAEALEILKTGKSVFLTGPAGSGKTHLLNQYIKYLRDNDVNVGITASTGIAATHMGGMTIHAYSGLGVRSTLTEYDIEELSERQYLWKRFEKTDVLIIDEISMLHHFRLDLVEKLVRNFKRNEKPWGGMQVIFCGDFFQLPPVSRRDEEEALFAYHSLAWKNMDLKVCYLEEQYRQNDDDFLSILNAIRDGNISNQHKEKLNSRVKSEHKKIKNSARLYTHNVDVDFENEKELGLISGNIFEYDMWTRGGEGLVETLKKGCLAPSKLRLKKGARVMFVKNNYEAGYANGTLGIVEDCGRDFIHVRTNQGELINVEPTSWQIDDGGKVKAEIAQYPLRLAWAITIHKSQGMSLDAVEVDLSKAFERGMGYVALSRVKNLDGLSIVGMNESALFVSDEVRETDLLFRELSDEVLNEFKNKSAKEVAEMQKEFLAKVAPLSKKGKKKINTVDTTANMILSGKSIKDVARERDLSVDTIVSHLEKIKIARPEFDFSFVRENIGATKLKKILFALSKVGTSGGVYLLSPTKHILGDEATFDEIRIGRLLMK